MGILAMSEALYTTIWFLLIWVVFFPALVTALIAFAAVQALSEKRENDEHRASRPS